MSAPKSRQSGRILPGIALRQRRTMVPWLFDKGCAICGKGRGYCVTENGREFCWEHSPNVAAQALASYSSGSTRFGGFVHKPYPDRKTAERILRLAGRTKAPKGKRSKQKRAPRKRARWR